MDAKRNEGGGTRRCAGVTRAGRPCLRRVVDEHFCRSHGSHGSHGSRTPDVAPAFYAHALDTGERERYTEALAQEGLTGEVAVLRLHLLRLLQRDDEEKLGEIPHTVHALIRALRGKESAATDDIAALDAAVQAEGLRLLGAEAGDATPLVPGPEIGHAGARDNGIDRLVTPPPNSAP